MAGVQVGLAGHTLLAVLGVSAVIAASPLLFKTLAVAGALYLGWIGLQGFRGRTMEMEGATRVGVRKALHDAMLCNLLNPKVIVLFLALLPNFVDPSRDDVTVQLLFCATVVSMASKSTPRPMSRAEAV